MMEAAALILITKMFGDYPCGHSRAVYDALAEYGTPLFYEPVESAEGGELVGAAMVWKIDTEYGNGLVFTIKDYAETSCQSKFTHIDTLFDE